MLQGVLQGEGHEQMPSDGLDVEGRIAGVDAPVGEGAHEVERAVVLLDLATVEIGGVDRGADVSPDGQALVDRAAAGIVHRQQRMGEVDARRPAGDGAVLGVIDEGRRPGALGARHFEAGRTVEHDAGGRRRRRSAQRRRDRDGESELGPPRVVERAEPRVVVGQPEGAGRRRGDSPGVDQVRVNGDGRHGAVRDQVIDDELRGVGGGRRHRHEQSSPKRRGQRNGFEV